MIILISTSVIHMLKSVTKYAINYKQPGKQAKSYNGYQIDCYTYV